ncbi:hypothetical protein [Urbifossiella limnaea]|uniref:Uncharacterized protein n=1 Tax=Urbifossiella limnaea TaxID=2528023 RepID=A0A517Y2B5_9BACT|nr:hypothetical protein [Urbifossiella limnaea]QDU23895.1 hypothetical protein ETAA1_59050 [Urbifossiella limnaea]
MSRRWIRSLFARPARRPSLRVEGLEPRDLPATLDLTGGTLTYTAGAKADVAVGSGAGRPAQVWLFPGAGFGPGTPTAVELDPFGGAVLTAGVFVG